MEHNYDNKKNNLVRLNDYYKNLYDEEYKRNEHLTGIGKIYLSILTFSIGVVVLKMKISLGIDEILANNSIIALLILFFIISTIIFILLSFIYTTLALRIRQYERLCDPRKFIAVAENCETECTLLEKIIANYTVATERNFKVNEKKAKLLSHALSLYIASVFMSILGFTFILLQ